MSLFREMWNDEPVFAVLFFVGAAFAAVMVMAPILFLGIPELVRWLV